MEVRGGRKDADVEEYLFPPFQLCLACAPGL